MLTFLFALLVSVVVPGDWVTVCSRGAAESASSASFLLENTGSASFSDCRIQEKTGADTWVDVVPGAHKRCKALPPGLRIRLGNTTPSANPIRVQVKSAQPTTTKCELRG